MATADRKAIEENIMKGIYQRNRARRMDWPYQQRPRDTDWRIWRKVLKLSLLDNVGNLRSSLRFWNDNINKVYLDVWE